MRAFDWTALWLPTWPPWEIALRATLVYAFVQFGLDRLFSFLIYHSRRFTRSVEGSPRLLVQDGRFLDDELRRALLTREELLSQLRLKGGFRLEEVKEAFLEPSGKVSFLFRAPPDERS